MKSDNALLGCDTDVRLLAEELVRACSKKGYGLTGFIFSASPTPFLMHIGSVSEVGPKLTELHVRLCDMADDGRPVVKRQVRMKGDA